MRSTGEYIGTHRTTDGELIVSFVIDESRKTLAELEKLEEQKVTIDVQKFYDKRSNQANAYLWVLCDKIAEKLNTTKDVVYLMELKDAGVFEDWEIPRAAVEKFASLWRTTEEQYTFDVEGLEMVCLRCWKGSHEYDTKQMTKLLNEVVFTAKGLGIETMTPEEIARALALWEARNE